MKTPGLVTLTIMISIELLGQPSNGVKQDLKNFESLPALQWKFSTNAPVFGTPVVAGNIAYVGSLDSTLYAIDMASGKLKWKFKTGGEIRSTVCLSGD